MVDYLSKFQIGLAILDAKMLALFAQTLALREDFAQRLYTLPKPEQLRLKALWCCAAISCWKYTPPS